MASFINPAWFEGEQHADLLVDENYLTLNEEQIENDLRSDFQRYGVDTVPVDVDGFIDSPILRNIAYNYTMFLMLNGSAGVAASAENPVYATKAANHYQLYTINLSKLCATMV